MHCVELDFLLLHGDVYLAGSGVCRGRPNPWTLHCGWAALVSQTYQDSFLPMTVSHEANLLPKLQTCRVVVSKITAGRPPYEEAQPSQVAGSQLSGSSQTGEWVPSSMSITALSYGNSWYMTNGNLADFYRNFNFIFWERSHSIAQSGLKLVRWKGILALAFWAAGTVGTIVPGKFWIISSWNYLIRRISIFIIILGQQDTPLTFRQAIISPLTTICYSFQKVKNLQIWKASQKAMILK